jgi:dynein heavy chain
MDVNIPKFTFNDVPLFSSITSDLFPKTTLPVIDYGKLKDSFIDLLPIKKSATRRRFLGKMHPTV